MRGMNARLYDAVVLSCVMALSAAAGAETRTTPVTVQNAPAVRIDSSQNLVQAQQSGHWSFSVSGTPSVSIFNVPTIKFDPTDNTVKAEQSGTWTVGISSTQNTVATPTQSQMIQCFTTDQTIADGASVSFYSPDLSSYKEARVALFCSSAHPSVTVNVLFEGPVSRYRIGTANFVPPAQAVITQANFQGAGYQCIFTVPLMSPHMRLDISNDSGSAVTLSRSSWVYVVN